MAWTYRLRYVRCGKANCGTCAGGFGHGPYWYGYEHKNGKVRSKYFGARPTSTFDSSSLGSEPTTNPRWEFKGRMDYKTAMRIMGFAKSPSSQALTQRWRQLVSEHHPDVGGDTRICAAINVAYSYVRP
jgi:IS1 family transposase